MGTSVRTTYAPGGYDPAKPNNNVVTSDSLTTSPEQDNADLIRQRLAAFLALPTPTAAQNAKAIKALVRLALAQLDTASDT